MPGYNNLIADAQLYLPLQETSGLTAFDASGKGRNGSLSNLNFTSDSVDGPTAWLPNALYADGTSPHKVFVLDHPDLRGGGQMTLCAWMKRDPTWNRLSAITKGAGPTDKSYGLEWHEFTVGSPELIFFAEVSNVPINVRSVQTSTDWEFCVATYDNVSGVCNIYLNESLVATDTNAGKSSSNTNSVSLFQQGYSNGTPKGALAGVGMWNRILTPEERQALYQGPSKPWLNRSLGVAI